jgi:hypothetical protein
VKIIVHAGVMMKYLIAALTLVTTAATTGGAQLVADLKNPAAQTMHPGGFGMEQPCNYDRCALRMTTGLITWRIVRGVEGASVGNLGMFTAPDLEPDFSTVPDAAAEIRPFRQGYSRSGMIMGVGAALVFGSIGVAATQGDNNWGALAVGVAGLPVIWYGSWLRGKSIEVLSRSIWLYNRSLPH